MASLTGTGRLKWSKDGPLARGGGTFQSASWFQGTGQRRKVRPRHELNRSGRLSRVKQDTSRAAPRSAKEIYALSQLEEKKSGRAARSPRSKALLAQLSEKHSALLGVQSQLLCLPRKQRNGSILIQEIEVLEGEIALLSMYDKRTTILL
jgi:hypothetical protein